MALRRVDDINREIALMNQEIMHMMHISKGNETELRRVEEGMAEKLAEIEQRIIPVIK